MSSVFLITGPSGAGKTSLAQGVGTFHWKECISHTTRPMRDGEVEGKTYFYVSEKEFQEMKKAGDFAESVTYGGNHYAISHKEIKEKTKNGNVYIIVDFEGYKQVKELYPDAIGIFIYMSKEDCMANMLLRGDSIDQATKRIDTYDDEMKNRIEFDYVIKNLRGKARNTTDILFSIVNQQNEEKGRNQITSVNSIRTR